MDLPIKCAECGAWIDGSINQRGELVIDLCEECQKAIEKKGYKEGYNDARKEFE